MNGLEMSLLTGTDMEPLGQGSLFLYGTCYGHTLAFNKTQEQNSKLFQGLQEEA